MDNIITVKIADKVIAVSALHGYIADYCKDYISDDTPDFTVMMNTVLCRIGRFQIAEKYGAHERRF